jgi:iron complex outermembrane receptor protein
VGSNRVLILVDGVPQNDNFNNAIAWVGWGHIPKEAIKRIEVLRGPSSAMYGSEGLGGVIHIITRHPRGERKTSLKAEGGTANTWSGDAFHSQAIGDMGILLAGGYQESDGFYMKDELEPYEIKRYRETGKLFGKASWDFGPSSYLTFSALYFDQDAGQGRDYFHNDLTLDQYWLNLSHDTDRFGIKGLLYLNRADKTAFQDTANDNYTSAFRDENFKGTKTWGGDIQATVFDLASLQLTVGTSFKQSDLDYNEDYHTATRDAGARGTQMVASPFFNMDTRLLSNHLIVNLGGRYDHIETKDGANWDTAASAGRPAYDNHYDRESEGSFSPKLGLAWHPDDRTTLRMSGGKGFRAPSLFERYKVHVRNGGVYYREANPDLEPEEIWSWDIGAERSLTDTIRAKATFYQSFARDYIGDRLIGTAPISGGRTRYDYRLDNISQVDIYGIEAELAWYPVAGLSMFTNYTFNNSTVDKDDTNADLEGNHLPNDPRHQCHAGLRYDNPDIVNASLTGNYYADIYYDNENTLKTSDYWTLDLALSRRFLDRFTAYLNIENLLDEKYPIFLSDSTGDTLAPGMIATVGLKIDL